MEKIQRQKPAELQPLLRNTNFDEVSLGYTLAQAQLEAQRCLNCKNAPCKKGCPVGIDIPSFINAINQEDLNSSIRKIKETNNLPSICGRVCPQEMQCEKLCVRCKMDEPVAIGALERFVGDYFLQANAEKLDIKPTGKRVAVIGSGPAGLSCAATLAKAGIKVTIFEAFHKAGGVLVYGIPEFRLPKKLVQKEIDNLMALGVEIRLNTVIGKTIFMEELIREYDGIFIGTGAGLPNFLNIKGEMLNGVFSANEYLTRVNLMGAYKKGSKTPVTIGKKVVVVGAGNVAMDSARTAKRLGSDVTIVYRRSRAEIPARKDEVTHAEEEGINFQLLTNPIEVLGENGRVCAVKCQRMELGKPDERGRRLPIEIPNSEFIIECDLFIAAVGTSPNPLLTASFKQLDTSKRGTIIVNESTFETSVKNVYAGGDAVTGAATVILAMGAGKSAAQSLIKKLVKS